MKNLLLLLTIPTLCFSTPFWLYTLEPDNSNHIIGYGIDSRLSKAKQSALSDISHYIHVNVDSSVNISTSDRNGKVNKSTSVNLKTDSKTTLSGAKFIKVEQVDGLWYVAAAYDNSPIESKLKKLLPDNLKDECQNNYLESTPLIEKLNTIIGKKLNYKIIRKDDLWQLQYHDILLPLNQMEFYQLFSNQNTTTFSITPNLRIYKENDEMYFKIEHKKSGYISILYVEYNGKVGTLLANHRSKTSLMYPDLKTEDVFHITNPYGKPIRELYIAIYSEKPINLHQFENVSDNLLDESNYNFDQLITKLNTLEYSTFEIKIRK